MVDSRVVFGALLGAISWNLLTWWGGLPSSSSHALIGGLIGAGIAKGGTGAIVWSGVLKTVGAIVLSPLIGFVFALLLVLAVSWIFVRSTPFAVDNTFRVLQLASAALYSLGHGGNDAQKTMGLIAGLLYAEGRLGDGFTCPFGLSFRVRRQWPSERIWVDGASCAQWVRGSPASIRCRVFARKWGGDHSVYGYVAGHPRVNDAYYHGSDYRCRRREESLRRPLEHCRQHRHCVGHHFTGRCANQCVRLCMRESIELIGHRWQGSSCSRVKRR